MVGLYVLVSVVYKTILCLGFKDMMFGFIKRRIVIKDEETR